MYTGVKLLVEMGLWLWCKFYDAMTRAKGEIETPLRGKDDGSSQK